MAKQPKDQAPKVTFDKGGWRKGMTVKHPGGRVSRVQPGKSKGGKR